MPFCVGAAGIILFSGCAFFSPDSAFEVDAIANISYQVIAEYPHDRSAFTQGLVFENGDFYESTGMWGESDLRQIEVESGRILKQQSLEKSLFGEGLALVGDRLIQLTWKSGRGFVYDKNTFDRIDEFSYSGEGWGLTFDGERLIMSDGTSELRFLDPITFAETGRIAVVWNGVPQVNLNELEYINGAVFANIWQTDTIVRIDPSSGELTGVLDLTELYSTAERLPEADVLNGIAYDAETNTMYVTGKYWPKMFALRILNS